MCDAGSNGATKDEVAAALAARKVQFDGRQRPGNSWMIEQEGSRCTILFDAGKGVVVKRKKTIVTD